MKRRTFLQSLCALVGLPLVAKAGQPPQPAVRVIKLWKERIWESRNIDDNIIGQFMVSVISNENKHVAMLGADRDAIKKMYQSLPYLDCIVKTIAWESKKDGIPNSIRFINGSSIRFYRAENCIPLGRLCGRRFSFLWVYGKIDYAQKWMREMVYHMIEDPDAAIITTGVDLTNLKLHN